MKRLFAVLVFACAAAQASDAIGVLTRVTGRVSILREGRTAALPAKGYELLFAGDRLSTAANSEAGFIFCAGAESGRILPLSEIRFDAGAVVLMEGKITDQQKIAACRLPQGLGLADASRQQAGGLRLRGPRLVLKAPRSTAVATSRPMFTWNALDGADDYQVTVLDREGRTVFETASASAELSYPPSAPPLEWAQTYRWRVAARSRGVVVKEASAHFQVLFREQAEMISQQAGEMRAVLSRQPRDATTRLLLAFLYDSNGMIDEAIEAYSPLSSVGWVKARILQLKEGR